MRFYRSASLKRRSSFFVFPFPESSSSSGRVPPWSPPQAAGPPAGWDQWEAEDYWWSQWVCSPLYLFYIHVFLFLIPYMLTLLKMTVKTIQFGVYWWSILMLFPVCLAVSEHVFFFLFVFLYLMHAVVTPNWNWSWLRSALTSNAWRARTVPRANAWRSSRKCSGVILFSDSYKVHSKQYINMICYDKDKTYSYL